MLGSTSEAGIVESDVAGLRSWPIEERTADWTYAQSMDKGFMDQLSSGSKPSYRYPSMKWQVGKNRWNPVNLWSDEVDASDVKQAMPRSSPDYDAITSDPVPDVTTAPRAAPRQSVPARMSPDVDLLGPVSNPTGSSMVDTHGHMFPNVVVRPNPAPRLTRTTGVGVGTTEATLPTGTPPTGIRPGMRSFTTQTTEPVFSKDYLTGMRTYDHNRYLAQLDVWRRRAEKTWIAEAGNLALAVSMLDRPNTFSDLWDIIMNPKGAGKGRLDRDQQSKMQGAQFEHDNQMQGAEFGHAEHMQGAQYAHEDQYQQNAFGQQSRMENTTFHHEIVNQGVGIFGGVISGLIGDAYGAWQSGKDRTWQAEQNELNRQHDLQAQGAYFKGESALENQQYAHQARINKDNYHYARDLNQQTHANELETQQASFSHDREMQAANYGYSRDLANQQHANDMESQAASFSHDKEMAAQNYGYSRDLNQQTHANDMESQAASFSHDREMQASNQGFLARENTKQGLFNVASSGLAGVASSAINAVSSAYNNRQQFKNSSALMTQSFNQQIYAGGASSQSLKLA